MKKRTRIVVGLVVLAAAAAVAVGIYTRRGGGDDSIRLSGNIELTEVELSFRIAGHMVERPIDEGDPVSTGRLVAKLDDRDLRLEVAAGEADLAQARAALAELEAGSRPEEIARAEAAAAQARAKLDELKAGSRPEEIQAAQATADRAKADLELAAVDLERARTLHDDGAVSASDLDAAERTYRAGEAGLREAEAQLTLVRIGPRIEEIRQAEAASRQAEENLALAVKGPREETIAQARARVKATETALAAAQTRLSYATLASPVTGTVLSKASEAGEFVAAGTPIVTVADLRSVWLRAYVAESDLGRIRIGQAADVTTDSYPGKVYKGRISFIAPEAEFTPKNVQTARERVKLVYRIKIDIPNEAMELKPGMPADAVIDTKAPVRE